MTTHQITFLALDTIFTFNIFRFLFPCMISCYWVCFRFGGFNVTVMLNLSRPIQTVQINLCLLKKKYRRERAKCCLYLLIKQFRFNITVTLNLLGRRIQIRLFFGANSILVLIFFFFSTVIQIFKSSKCFYEVPAKVAKYQDKNSTLILIASDN